LTRGDPEQPIELPLAPHQRLGALAPSAGRRRIQGAPKAQQGRHVEPVCRHGVKAPRAGGRDRGKLGPDRIHVARPRTGERLDAGPGLEHAVTAGLQQRLDRREILVAFVGQQDGFHSRAAPCFPVLD